MSHWTHVYGAIRLGVIEGRSKILNDAIRNDTLSHMPVVTGSEKNMFIYSTDSVNDGYHVTLDGHLRDRDFDQTLRELSKFLVRLSKRLWVRDVIVIIRSFDKEYIIKDNHFYGTLYDEDA